jgi:hypothetical protein
VCIVTMLLKDAVLLRRAGNEQIINCSRVLGVFESP